MTSSTSSAASSVSEKVPTARALAILVSVAAGFIAAALDLTVVNIAGPEVRRSLSLSVEGLTWAIDGYMLTFASLLILAGAVAARYGAKRIYVWGLVVFVVASGACAVAPSGAVLIVARLIQGAAAAAFIPSSLVLLANSFPDVEQRKQMVALWSTAGAAASGVGPVIGGLLVSSFGWRSIFYLNIPVVALGLTMSLVLVSAVSPTSTQPINYTKHSYLLIAAAGASLLLITGPSHRWTGPLVVASAVAAVLFAALFIWTDLRSTDRTWPKALIRRPGFVAMTIVGFGLNFGLYGVLYIVGLLLQVQFGLSPRDAGFQLLPIMIVFVVANLLFSRFVAKVGTRWPVIAGLAVASLACIPIWLAGPSIGLLALTAALMVGNIGLGTTAPAMTVGLMESAGKEFAPIASSTFNATRQFGTLLGVAAAGSIIASTTSLISALELLLVVSCTSYVLSAIIVAALTRATAKEG